MGNCKSRRRELELSLERERRLATRLEAAEVALGAAQQREHDYKDRIESLLKKLEHSKSAVTLPHHYWQHNRELQSRLDFTKATAEAVDSELEREQKRSSELAEQLENMAKAKHREARFQERIAEEERLAQERLAQQKLQQLWEEHLANEWQDVHRPQVADQALLRLQQLREERLCQLPHRLQFVDQAKAEPLRRLTGREEVYAKKKDERESEDGGESLHMKLEVMRQHVDRLRQPVDQTILAPQPIGQKQ